MVNGVSMDFCAQNPLSGEVELQTVRCRRCHAPLGWSTPSALVLAGGIVLQRTTIYCPVCRKARTWRPIDAEKERD